MKKNNDSSKVILTLVIALLGLFYFYHHKYFYTAAVILGLIGIFFPWLSDKIAMAWMWLAELLGKFMPKIILSILFFVVFVPFALLYRVFKKDPLNIKRSQSPSIYKERNHLFTASDIENPW